MSNKKENIRDSLDRFSYWVFAVSGLAILFTFLAYAMNGYISSEKLDTEKLGHFGDFVGGLVGVFLTFLATVLIYLTYRSQKQELELSRELFSKQNFENTFFNMLNVHRELRKEISFDTSKASLLKNDAKIIKGKSFFEFAHKDFIELWKKEYVEYETPKDDPHSHDSLIEYKYDHSFRIGDTKNHTVDQHLVDKHLKFVIEKYNIFWKSYANYLGDYFRNIYHILKYISDEKKNELKNVSSSSKKKIINKKYKKYADILQSQMSYSELFFMFYNAQKYTKVKPYIKEFDFVENLTINNLLDYKHEKFKGMGKIRKE